MGRLSPASGSTRGRYGLSKAGIAGHSKRSDSSAKNALRVHSLKVLRTLSDSDSVKRPELSTLHLAPFMDDSC